ncbi:MAG TPA: PH domain-containing protein [Catenuloplanes sp.]|jgi:hypothetical protein
MSSTPEPVRFRPRRLRAGCGIAAVAILVLCVALSTGLRGRTGDGLGQFRAGDQAAMIGLGVLAALGVLALGRPLVRADSRGVRVRNLIGGYDLPWTAVRHVRFEHRSPWATLELSDDEVVAVHALQALDREYAVRGVRALRALHAAATAAPADPPGA